MALSTDRTAARSRIAAHARSTFMVEALLLLACVLILLALAISLLSFSADASGRAQRLQEASGIAQNVAEEFLSDPAGMSGTQRVGDYVVRCDVDAEPSGAGVLYNGRVTVVHNAEELCALDVWKYVDDRSEKAAGGGSSLRNDPASWGMTSAGLPGEVGAHE